MRFPLDDPVTVALAAGVAFAPVLPVAWLVAAACRVRRAPLRLLLVLVLGATSTALSFTFLLVIAAGAPFGVEIGFAPVVVIFGASWLVHGSVACRVTPTWRRGVSSALTVAVGLLLPILGAAVMIYAPVQPKVRLAADQDTLRALRTAIVSYHQEHQAYPPDRATLERRAVPSPPAWQCPGQGWHYDPLTGRATLLVNDASRC